MYFAVDESNELRHHGIKGQKWGIRRFQNADGTRTAAGKAREKESSSGAQNGSGIDKKKLAKGVAIAGVVAGAAVLAANPATRAALAKYGKTAISNLPNAAGKVGYAVGKGAGKLSKKVAGRASKLGDSMVDAALISIGGIAISKVADKLAAPNNASEFEKNKSRILTDVASAGIRTMTNANGGSGNGSKGGGTVKTDVADKVGQPSNKGVNKQSTEWSNLFKDSDGNQRDADTRATIKAMANAGYDIDQINKYLNHSALQEWADSYCAKFGW